MKKKYIVPEFDTIDLLSKDIMATSDQNSTIEGEFGMGDKEEGWL